MVIILQSTSPVPATTRAARARHAKAGEPLMIPAELLKTFDEALAGAEDDVVPDLVAPADDVVALEVPEVVIDELPDSELCAKSGPYEYSGMRRRLTLHLRKWC